MDNSYLFSVFSLLLLLNSNTLLCLVTPFNINSTNTDQISLLAFKNTITSDPYSILAKNWSENVSVCHWIGVSCSIKHQRVISLNISRFDLNGTVSPHLGNLTFLRYLDISSNNFTGNIPSELSNLYRLRRIDIGFNSFTGEIPLWFGALPQLQQLILRNNTFSGGISPYLFNNSKLQTISLSYNQLTGSIPYGIFNVSSIREIWITYNYISGTLSSDICNNTPNGLKTLALSGNQLEGRIPPNIRKCRDIEVLSLSFNRFNGEIPSEIGSLSMLRELYLGHNDFEGGIPAELGNLSRLEILNIGSSASLTGPIPKQIWNCSSLKYLYLANNYLTEYGSEGKVSRNGDVYSYGILLLEMFTGKKPTDDMFSEEMTLKNYACEALQENIVTEIVAPHLLAKEDQKFSVKEECVSSILSFAMKCLAISPEERINMIQTVATLQKIKTKVVAGTTRPEEKN